MGWYYQVDQRFRWWISNKNKLLFLFSLTFSSILLFFIAWAHWNESKSIFLIFGWLLHINEKKIRWIRFKLKVLAHFNIKAKKYKIILCIRRFEMFKLTRPLFRNTCFQGKNVNIQLTGVMNNEIIFCIWIHFNWI